MTLQIHHSGQTFTSLGRSSTGGYIWPVEELLARRKFGRAVAARVQRLNADGIEEGTHFRGYFPKPLSWRKAKAALQAGGKPRHAFRKKDGKGIGYPLELF